LRIIVSSSNETANVLSPFHCSTVSDLTAYTKLINFRSVHITGTNVYWELGSFRRLFTAGEEI